MDCGQREHLRRDKRPFEESCVYIGTGTSLGTFQVPLENYWQGEPAAREPHQYNHRDEPREACSQRDPEQKKHGADDGS
jgi:hypothetical protein